MFKYKLVACGGTFDLLHAGHKYFLEQVLDTSENVIIGLTSDLYISKNKPNKGIASFNDRKKSLERFLEQIHSGKRVEIIPIDDIYGPLLDPKFEVDALAISKNRENAMKINEERKGRGLAPLEVIELDLKRGEDGEVVSSTRIREGEIDKEGKNLILPSTLRYLLQDAWGEVMENPPANLEFDKVITVGDVTTAKFRNLGKIPKISIVDFKVQRVEVPKIEFENSNILKIKNSPGTISNELSKAVKEALQNTLNTVIVVDGEEDLAVLPCLLYAPIGFEVYYGQPVRLFAPQGKPTAGLVRIKVNEDVKEKAKELIDKFEAE